MQFTIRRLSALLAAFLVLLALGPVYIAAQNQARRLILKDGTYQSITKYEVHGDRVRYFSAERGEWEEVPNNLIDWDATEKFEQGRSAGKLAPEAVELDKQLESERKAELDRTPEVARGLRLPGEGGIFLLDTYENQPQLSELQQSGSELQNNSKSNILRSAINPLAGSKQTIELPDAHAKIQSHTTIPSLYINADTIEGAPATTQATVVDSKSSPTANNPNSEANKNDHFKIIRLEAKGNHRVAGTVRVAVNGKTKADQRFVATTTSTLTGGWVKLTPTEPLSSGEYALAEMLGKDGMNLYVWDFGVDPKAPANANPWKPLPEEKLKSDQPADSKNPEKQP